MRKLIAVFALTAFAASLMFGLAPGAGATHYPWPHSHDFDACVAAGGVVTPNPDPNRQQYPVCTLTTEDVAEFGSSHNSNAGFTIGVEEFTAISAERDHPYGAPVVTYGDVVSCTNRGGQQVEGMENNPNCQPALPAS
jgi:hypothetical protein